MHGHSFQQLTLISNSSHDDENVKHHGVSFTAISIQAKLQIVTAVIRNSISDTMEYSFKMHTFLILMVTKNPMVSLSTRLRVI